MTRDFINYASLIDEAMHIIVKKSLEIAARNDLPGDHHFFISFITNFKGVELSEKLRKKYPEEMTIVLQYQFDDLKVDLEGFSVILSFDGVKEKVRVPFAALTAFADPSVKFGLQFRYVEDYQDNFLSEAKSIIDEMEEGIQLSAPNTNDLGLFKDEQEDDNNVIVLDAFRKKKKNSEQN